MIIRESIIDTVQKIPQPFLFERYEIIKTFEVAKTQAKPEPSLMEKLRNIKISAASDFSQTAGLYRYEVK